MGKIDNTTMRPHAEIRRSLLGTLEDGFLDAGSAEYDWHVYSAKSEKAQRFLRSLVQSPMTNNHGDLDEQAKALHSLLDDNLVVCHIEGSIEVFTISARGLRVLQMEHGGDIFGQTKQHEMDAFFNQPDVNARIITLAYKFKSYYSDDITPDKVRAFLGQFEVPSDARRMLSILELVQFYPKIEVTRLLRHYLSEATSSYNNNFSVVLFGNLADSTAEMTQTVLKDVFPDKENVQIVCGLPDAIESEGKIVLIDDNIGSGTQSVQILKELLGIQDGEPEHISEPLTKEEIAHLRDKEICLVCCHGTYDGIRKINEFSQTQNLNLSVYCDRIAPRDIFANDYIPFLWSNAGNLEYWRERFQKLGEKLLANCPSEDKRKRDALGWKNGRGLIVYAHNVPTTTLTFLWKGYSDLDGRWIALFHRRE